MGTVPPVRRAFFPLDEELQLLAGPFTPSLVESIVRLGTWMPFGPVTQGVEYFCKVDLSEATARRKTEQAGQAYVAVQTAQVDAIERARPVGPPGPAVQPVSVDGAMVPLLHQEWGEVKTLAVGVVGPPVLNKKTGETHIHRSDRSYFSRMTDHDTFSRLAPGETQRRGTATAGTVCAVNDGAVWEQQFVDDHRPDAVRILDWGHGAERIGQVGRAVFGPDTPAADTWRTAQLKELKTGDPDRVLRELRQLREDLAGGVHGGGEAEALAVVTANLDYLEKRREQLRYAAFAQVGYPIGSGAVESGNKLVVEARLKGAGMHWAPAHVNSLVALRTVACSDRGEEAWPQITARLRAQVKERAARRRAQRNAAPVAGGEPPAEQFRPAVAGDPPDPGPGTVVAASESPESAHRLADQAKPSAGPGRPAANHPWRRPLSVNRRWQGAA
jgi:hypothetical protein